MYKDMVIGPITITNDINKNTYNDNQKKKHNEQKMTLTKNIYKNTNNDNDNKIAQ